MKHWRLPPRNNSVPWHKKYSTEIRDTPIIQELFDTRTILEHRRLPLRINLLLWDKNFSTENRYLPLLRSKKFDTRKKWKKGSSTKCFGNVRQKDAKKSWYSFYTENFWYQYISETQKVHLRLFLVLWDKEFSTENCDIPLLCLYFFDTRN